MNGRCWSCSSASSASTSRCISRRPKRRSSTKTTPARFRSRPLSRAPIMAEIELRHIDKHFGPVHVIRDVNLTVKDKEFVVFLGPSGCGKTTTLRAIAGLEEKRAAAHTRHEEKPIQNLHAPDRDIAFVFQNYALYPHFTVYENL